MGGEELSEGFVSGGMVRVMRVEVYLTLAEFERVGGFEHSSVERWLR